MIKIINYKPSLCWDCKRAGHCNKPINGWDAIYNPIQTYVCNDKKYYTDSWWVKTCPKFVPERWVTNKKVKD